MKKNSKVVIECEGEEETGTLISFKKIKSIRIQNGWTRIFQLKIKIPEGIINMTAFKTEGQNFYQEI